MKPADREPPGACRNLSSGSSDTAPAESANPSASSLASSITEAPTPPEPKEHEEVKGIYGVDYSRSVH